MHTIFIAPLEQLGRDDLAWAGGKGANLGELVRAGFPVPYGLVVTTDAYDFMLEVTGLGWTIAASLEEGPTAGATIREAFLAADVPPEIEQEIVQAYRELLGAGAVAVRSSATAEDLPGATFAGQQDTYLNVLGEEAVLDAVLRCWASLWTDRAIAYRRKRGIDSREVRIAVVVQSMIEAESAGVMFTANPVTGDRGQIVIDASSGLGEAVVSGVVTPDHYVLDTRGKILEWAPGRREVVIRSMAGGGVTHQTGDTSQARRLPDKVLKELARLGTDVGHHFGRPQDIEWAYAEGRVRLLQARPMTALPPPPVRLNAAQRRLGSVLLDYLPVRPYPIDMTTWVPLGPVGLMAKVTARFGIRNAFDGFLPEDEYGVVDRLVPGSPRPTLQALRAPWRIASLARRHDTRGWTEDPRFADFLAGVHDLAAQDLATMPWPRLVAVPRQALDLVTPIGDLRIDYLPRTVLALLRLRVVLGLLRRASLMGEMILGAPNRTADANRALEALAARAREDPRLLAAVGELDPQRLAALSVSKIIHDEAQARRDRGSAKSHPGSARSAARARAATATTKHRSKKSSSQVEVRYATRVSRATIFLESLTTQPQTSAKACRLPGLTLLNSSMGGVTEERRRCLG
jgi:rifampicin phosphotransferase